MNEIISFSGLNLNLDPILHVEDVNKSILLEDPCDPRSESSPQNLLLFVNYELRSHSGERENNSVSLLKRYEMSRFKRRFIIKIC